jgi:hypothetical protein
LRRKLRQAGAGPCVVNVWGVGYRLLESPAYERLTTTGVVNPEERTPRQSRDIPQVVVASGK